jgi:Peptidase family M28
MNIAHDVRGYATPVKQFIDVSRLRSVTFMTFAAFALVAAAPAPDPAKLRGTVERLISFGTRHTASSATDPKRGIGAARNWVAAEFARLGKACGGCIEVNRPARRFDGPRAPNGVMVEDVLGIQSGFGDPNNVVVVAAHIDSRASDVMNATGDAPGANDDGSGVALVMEAARILSQSKHRATIIYAVLSGEEQGLWGGKLLADTLKETDWNIVAMLNNDIVGNSIGQDGRVVNSYVRVFSEGIGAAEDLATLKLRRASGGEDDSPSRALAKRIAHLAADQDHIPVMAIRRPDRFGRGGDHTPMLEAGYPAVRFTVGVENYDAQHQDPRTENGRVYGDTVERMDFAYLAKVTTLNIAVLRDLAAAPPAPASATLGGAVSVDTIVKWTPVRDAASYRIRWRRADRTDWEQTRDVANSVTEATLNGVIVDDNFVGVSALSKDGAESLVTFAGLPTRP